MTSTNPRIHCSERSPKSPRRSGYRIGVGVQHGLHGHVCILLGACSPTMPAIVLRLGHAGAHSQRPKELDHRGDDSSVGMGHTKGLRQRVKTVRRFTAEELARLPLKHDARANPDLEIGRTDTVRVVLPPITTLEHEDRIKAYFTV